MPFPKVMKKDTLKSYESKCMASKAEVKAFPNAKQRYAVCASHFKQMQNKKK